MMDKDSFDDSLIAVETAFASNDRTERFRDAYTIGVAEVVCTWSNQNELQTFSGGDITKDRALPECALEVQYYPPKRGELPFKEAFCIDYDSFVFDEAENTLTITGSRKIENSYPKFSIVFHLVKPNEDKNHRSDSTHESCR